VDDRTLGSVLAHHAARQPDRLFLVFESSEGTCESLTYAGFEARVNGLSRVLYECGVTRGDRVHVHLPNCPEFLLAWFACARLGAVMVPTNPVSTAAELGYILSHSEARVTLTTEAAGAVVREAAPVACVVLVTHAAGAPPRPGSLAERMSRASSAPFPTNVAAEDPVAILYTSGTTARPKGVVITHAAMLHGAEVMARATRLGADDRHLVVLPLFHAAAQMHAVLPSLLVGGSVALMERFSAGRFFDQAIRHGATRAALFAAPIRMLLAQPRREEHRSNALRSVTFAQNVTEAQLAEWEERFRAPLLQLWGMTETVGLPLINPLDGPRRNMTMGLPAPGYECRVVDEGGRDVPPGGIGELIVRADPGRTVMREYFRDPGATAATLRDGWLHSGDQVRWCEDGYVAFVDRAKDLIKRAGENISSGEVEAVLRTHPAVFDAAVVGIPDAVRDERVKAVVVPRPGSSVTAEELRDWCAGRLAAFKVPEVVEFRDELPRTSVGKIQKHVLRQSGGDRDAHR
jgi:crotonobetaine/carnitine-CoA ligase